MPKINGPLLSFGAGGQIGKTAVFSKWRGVPYVRQYAVPANPNTTEQQKTRSAFSFLQQVFKFAPADFTLAWTAYATGKKFTDRNAFTSFNLPGLRGQADLANFVFSPGALGGPPPASISLTDGAGTITVDITPPDPAPTGWTVARAIAAAILDQDPDTGTAYDIVVGTDDSSTYQVVLSGLSASLYRVGAWLEWTRPDGKLAYSPALTGSETPS